MLYSQGKLNFSAAMYRHTNQIIVGSIASEYCENDDAQLAAAWDSIASDLLEVSQICMQVMDEAKRPEVNWTHIRYASWFVVVQYSRCFNEARGRNRARFLTSHVQSLGSEFLINFHNELRRLRDKLFAHAGEYCSFRPIVHLVTGDDGKDDLILSFEALGPGRFGSDADLARVCELALKFSDIAIAERDRYIKAAKQALVLDPDLKERLRSNRGLHANAEHALAVQAGAAPKE